MPRPNQVKITKDGQEAYVLDTSVKAYERHGWTRADDGSSEEKPPTVTQATQQTPEKEG